MKNTPLILLLAMSIFIFSGCATKVERVSRESQVDLSGDWNDFDAMLVSQEFISSALSGPWIKTFSEENNRSPTLIVGHIVNRSSEHINTQIFVKYLERELMQSGKIIFVASSDEREGIRDEREDMQRGFTDPATIKEIGREKGADFMFIGSVNSIKDQEKNKSVILYQVNMELVDITTNVKVWLGQKDIKKVITKSRFSF